jgi:hypothetical protein
MMYGVLAGSKRDPQTLIYEYFAPQSFYLQSAAAKAESANL